MSRKRNRHRSLSTVSRDSERSKSQSQKKDLIGRSTTNSIFLPNENRDGVSYELRNQEKLFNRNITFFRDNFNQNDPSQLPFMSSLREEQQFNPQTSKTITVCRPFETALKNTSNQITKKQISDFGSKVNRLSVAYYRWHNRSGKNNKWGVQFECSLRDYGNASQRSRQKQFYPYVAPITYRDVESQQYDISQMICGRHNKSFKIR